MANLLVKSEFLPLIKYTTIDIHFAGVSSNAYAYHPEFDCIAASPKHIFVFPFAFYLLFIYLFIFFYYYFFFLFYFLFFIFFYFIIFFFFG